MSCKKLKILFICKKNNTSYGISYGLINSCKFVCNALERFDIDCKVSIIQDYNCIDKEIHKFKPDFCIIEAIWVTPCKLRELAKLHKKVLFIVRVHSKTPFLAGEGMGVNWLKEYNELNLENVFTAANNETIVNEYKDMFDYNFLHLPNIYWPNEPHAEFKKDTGFLRIGSLGAIRPLKNQLEQAVAAIVFANKLNRKMSFHINQGRIEMFGDPVVRNLRALFKNSPHTLIEHQWVNHSDFIKIIKSLDISMQVSFSETFNIVLADSVWNNIPSVGSNEIFWLHDKCKANTTNYKDMVEKLELVHNNHTLARKNLKKLKEYNESAIGSWLNYLG